MDEFDIGLTSLTLWRENRGGGYDGMQSVLNAIANRARKHGTYLYEECTKPKQFTSMTVEGDPELILYPSPQDSMINIAVGLVVAEKNGTLKDLTNGATLYYNPNSIVSDHTFKKPDGTLVKFPKKWDVSKVEFTVEIKGHLFFREVS